MSLFLKNGLLLMYLCLSVFVRAVECSGWPEVSDLLELELEAFVSWTLGSYESS